MYRKCTIFLPKFFFRGDMPPNSLSYGMSDVNYYDDYDVYFMQYTFVLNAYVFLSKLTLISYLIILNTYLDNFFLPGACPPTSLVMVCLM